MYGRYLPKNESSGMKLFIKYKSKRHIATLRRYVPVPRPTVEPRAPPTNIRDAQRKGLFNFW